MLRARDNWQFRIQLRFVFRACFELEIWSNSNFQTGGVRSRRRYQTSNKNEEVEFRRGDFIYLLVTGLADLDVYVKIERRRRRTNRIWDNWQFRIQLRFVLRACFELEIIDSFALNWDLFFTHVSCSRSGRIRISRQRGSDLGGDIRFRTRMKKSNFAKRVSSICSWRD